MLTYYVVQSFERGKRGAIIADPPVEARDSNHAEKMAARLSEQKAGVIAFSRTGDPTTGDFEDAQIIAWYGIVPDIEEGRAVA